MLYEMKDITIHITNVNKDRIEITVRAIKDGLTENSVYCKHCEHSIAGDSNFVKKNNKID